MTMPRMSRAAQRRFNAQGSEFRRLIENDPGVCRHEWTKQVLGRLYEIHRRARNWSEGTEFRDGEIAEGLTERGPTEVFGVVECAERFIAACGQTCEDMVGKETRAVLTGERVTAVTRVVDRRLNHMIAHKNYRGAKNCHKGSNRS